MEIGCEDTTFEEILAAARLAEVDEFVNQMPTLYDTRLGERSAGLSRGQRQRIAIARAALGNHEILLFDEPTTGLDLMNQRIVTDSLISLAAGKTAIMVTHDLQLARRADEIVYLKDGQVHAKGRHEELLIECPDYSSVFNNPDPPYSSRDHR
jgi:ATP-binding cassette subfamily B protein